MQRYLPAKVVNQTDKCDELQSNISKKWNKTRNFSQDTLRVTKTFFDLLGGELGSSSVEDWYRVTREVICAHGGRWVVEGGVWELLCQAYPDVPWRRWEWKPVPKGYWD